MHQHIDSSYSPTPCSTMPIYYEEQYTKKREKKKLWLALIICFIFFLIELVGGIWAQSLAILSDSFHLFTDLISFGISLSAIYISHWQPTKRYTFGYHRAEVLGAFLSILLIYVLTLYLIYEAVERVRNPTPINGVVMFGIALAGVVINIILGCCLHDHGHHGHSHHHHEDKGYQEIEKDDHHAHHHHNLNLKAAFIHIIGDLISSIGVLIASIMIMTEELRFKTSDHFENRFLLADPICTFIFAVFVILTTIPLMKQCIQILMEASSLNTEAIQQTLLQMDSVEEILELKSWCLALNLPILSITVKLKFPDEPSAIATFHDYQMAHKQKLEEIRSLMWKKYKIRPEHCYIDTEYCKVHIEGSSDTDF